MIFYFNIYKDEIYAVRLAKQLNDVFPGVKAIAIADGPCYLPSIDQAMKFNPNLEFIQGDRLKNASTGGMMFTDRNFSEILKLDFDIAIKLDPDSYVWREPSYIPGAPWFGNTRKSTMGQFGNDINFISGGAMGFKRSAVEKIKSSELLLDKYYDRIEAFYNRYKRFQKVNDPVGGPDWIRTEDMTLAHVCSRLSIEPTHWDDVKCVQLEEQIYPGLEYSITHPVRTVW